MSTDKSGLDWTGHMEPPADICLRSPGGYIPPVNPKGIRAVLSEGEAWVDPDALNRYGAAFFERLGGVPAANIHPIPTGRLRDSIVKLSTVVSVSRELLDPARPSPEDVRRWRAERADRDAREDARHTQLLAAGGVVAAVAGLHSPDNHRDCTECQEGDFMASWPCHTWELLDERTPRSPSGGV